MGSSGAHWVQLPPPRTYKKKYEKLRELIIMRYNDTKELKRYEDRHDELRGLRVLINTMERKSNFDNPWKMNDNE